MSDLYNIPTSHYNLGRLSLVMPEELQPQIKNFYYIWDSRTKDKYDFIFGYPISLQEYPFDKEYSQHEQWRNTIENIKQKYKNKIIFDWNLNELFSRNACFICLKKWRGECSFFVFVQEIKCILHYTYTTSFRSKEIPKKGVYTDNIIKSIFNFYKKYKFGHDNIQENVFFTYFGEILNNKFNNNEKMLLKFNNKSDTLRWSIDTDINPIGKDENSLSSWMVKNRKFNLYSSRMIKIPKFPGNAYELIRKNNDDFFTFNLYYNGPPRSTNIPSFHMCCVKFATYSLKNCLDYWNIIIQNISPLQKKILWNNIMKQKNIKEYKFEDDIIKKEINDVNFFQIMSACNVNYGNVLRIKRKKLIIVFVPGIMASRLVNSDGDVIWDPDSLDIIGTFFGRDPEERQSLLLTVPPLSTPEKKLNI